MRSTIYFCTFYFVVRSLLIKFVCPTLHSILSFYKVTFTWSEIDHGKIFTAFSARSNLEPIVSRDVVERHSSIPSHKSGRQWCNKYVRSEGIQPFWVILSSNLKLHPVIYSYWSNKRLENPKSKTNTQLIGKSSYEANDRARRLHCLTDKNRSSFTRLVDQFFWYDISFKILFWIIYDLFLNLSQTRSKTRSVSTLTTSHSTDNSTSSFEHAFSALTLTGHFRRLQSDVKLSE